MLAGIPRSRDGPIHREIDAPRPIPSASRRLLAASGRKEGSGKECRPLANPPGGCPLSHTPPPSTKIVRGQNHLNQATKVGAHRVGERTGGVSGKTTKEV